MNPTLPLRNARPQRGLSLIELMVSITLGMLVVAAVLALYLNITRTNNEMAKANRQIENGRFAIQVLQGDLVHAGFWGPLGYTVAAPMPAPIAIPDPCVVAGWDDDYKKSLLAIPVQGYADASTLGADCKVSNVLASSDVLVVRHANTCTVGTAGCDGTGPYIQISACRTDTTTPDAAYEIDSDKATLKLRNKSCLASDIAEVRKVVSNIYYLCNHVPDTGCAPGTSGIPTLMRASLINGAYSVQPMIEGIEALRFEYGIDTLGRNGLAISASNPGDGSADTYVSSDDIGDKSQHANIVAARIHVLARNLEKTPGHKDSKSYQLGESKIAAMDDGYKRHVFSTTVRLVNPSARREAP